MTDPDHSPTDPVSAHPDALGRDEAAPATDLPQRGMESGRRAPPTPAPAAAGVPLGTPLPAGLPPNVTAFLAAQAIVTRGQAAVCLACLEIEPAILAGVRLDLTEIRRALEVLQIDVPAAYALMREQAAVRHVAPPPGVPLNLPPGSMPDETMDDAAAPEAFGVHDPRDLFGMDPGENTGPGAAGHGASPDAGDAPSNPAPASTSAGDHGVEPHR